MANDNSSERTINPAVIAVFMSAGQTVVRESAAREGGLVANGDTIVVVGRNGEPRVLNVFS